MIVALVLLAVGFVLTGVVVWREHRRFVDAEDDRGRNEELHLRQMGEVVNGETRLRLSLDAIAQGVMVADSSGTVLYRNPYAQPFTEARHGEALVEATVAELFAEAAGGDAAEREVELFGPPHRCLFIRVVPLRLVGRDHGLVALIDDVTEPRRLDAMRRDFVSNISHELRTPMGALSLLAETLIGETDPEVVSRLAVRVQTEASRLSGIMDDLLELSRIENDETSERAPVALQHVIQDALSRVKPAAEKKRMVIRTVLPSRDLVVLADRRQLTSAVFNLLDNAIKYSEADRRVEVTVRTDDVCVEVEVRDQGYGIPPNHQERVFERFYQVDPSRERIGDGIGLGLAIVRHVATNHGGEVEVESKVGEGSTFRFSVPIRDDAAMTEADRAVRNGSHTGQSGGDGQSGGADQPVGART